METPALTELEREVAGACVAHRQERRLDAASFAGHRGPSHAVAAELIVPPPPRLVGQTLDALRMRETRGLAALANVGATVLMLRLVI